MKKYLVKMIIETTRVVKPSLGVASYSERGHYVDFEDYIDANNEDEAYLKALNNNSSMPGWASSRGVEIISVEELFPLEEKNFEIKFEEDFIKLHAVKYKLGKWFINYKETPWFGITPEKVIEFILERLYPNKRVIFIKELI